MQERENILRIFQETKNAIKQGNVGYIKQLSNQTTNTASLAQDPQNIAAAVVVYSLSKILENEDYRNLSGWKKFYNTYLQAIDRVIEAIKKKDDKAYDENIKLIHKTMEGVSGKLKEYVQDVFRKASISKASKLYEHGISMEKTANLLGITLFDVADYAGVKPGADIPESITVSTKQRIKFAMEMFE